MANKNIVWVSFKTVQWLIVLVISTIALIAGTINLETWIAINTANAAIVGFLIKKESKNG
jgi:hypothetical protein